MQDNLDAWNGLGASFLSIWRGRYLGRALRLQLAAVAMFFLAGAVLHVVVPATISVRSTYATVTGTFLVNRMPGNVTASDFVSSDLKINSTLVGALSALPYIMKETAASIGTPAGVADG